MTFLRCLALSIALLPLVACDPGIPAEAAPIDDVSHVILGPIDIEASVRTSETSTSSFTLEGATRIELHERYVVLRDREGRGSLITLDRLASLTWTKK